MRDAGGGSRASCASTAGAACLGRVAAPSLCGCMDMRVTIFFGVCGCDSEGKVEVSVGTGRRPDGAGGP